MMSKRFQKTRIVDKWGGIYDSETDEILDVNDVEYKLNEFETKCHKLEKEIKLLKPTNIEQYEQIIQLQKENEQLKQEVFVYKKAFQDQVQRCTL